MLSGTRILIVEDEAIVAFALEDMLIELGCEVVGPVMRLADALALIDTEAMDAAVLDVNLAGERSYPIADELARRGVPYVFATGYGADGAELHTQSARVLAKPYRQHELESALRDLVALRPEGA